MGQRYSICHFFLPTPSSISLNCVGICWEFSNSMKINPNPPPDPNSSFSRDREKDLPKETKGKLDPGPLIPSPIRYYVSFSVSSSTLNYSNPPSPENVFPFMVSRLLLNCLNFQVFTVLLPCPSSTSAGLPNSTLRSPEWETGSVCFPTKTCWGLQEDKSVNCSL